MALVFKVGTLFIKTASKPLAGRFQKWVLGHPTYRKKVIDLAQVPTSDTSQKSQRNPEPPKVLSNPVPGNATCAWAQTSYAAANLDIIMRRIVECSRVTVVCKCKWLHVQTSGGHTPLPLPFDLFFILAVSSRHSLQKAVRQTQRPAIGMQWHSMWLRILHFDRPARCIGRVTRTD